MDLLGFILMAIFIAVLYVIRRALPAIGFVIVALAFSSFLVGSIFLFTGWNPLICLFCGLVVFWLLMKYVKPHFSKFISGLTGEKAAAHHWRHPPILGDVFRSFLKCIHRVYKFIFIPGKEYSMFFKKRFDFKKSMNIYKCILCILLWKNLPIRNRFDSKKLKSFSHYERRLRFVCFKMLFDMHPHDRYQFSLIHLLKNDGYIVIHSNRYNYHPVLKPKVMKFELCH